VSEDGEDAKARANITGHKVRHMLPIFRAPTKSKFGQSSSWVQL
jgi:hypothetical protein